MDGEKRSEAWVRIVGLPVSLWDRAILRRIGEECGGFLAVDSQTEKLEDLQWAWILVKLNGEKLPNVVEVWVEDLCYEVTLWWEVRPVLRTAMARKSGNIVGTESEVGGEAIKRAVERVRGEDDAPRLEDLLRPADGTRGQTSGLGQAVGHGWCSVRPSIGPQGSGGPPSPRRAEPFVASGPAPLEAFPCEFGLSHFGLPSLKGSGWAKAKEPIVPGLGCRGLTLPLAEERAQLGASYISGPRLMGGPNHSISSFWVYESLRRPLAEEQLLEENSKTDCALMEEASRHGNASNPCGTLVCDFSSPPSFSGRTPLGEYYDHSGPGLEKFQRESPGRMVIGKESSVMETVSRWELMEVNNGSIEESGEELCLASATPLEVRGWEETSWEESDLPRFNKFLGFSIEGLEKDILELLVKIRKRRERVHSKTLLEKSKFERELKRLECSINYEGGRK